MDELDKISNELEKLERWVAEEIERYKKEFELCEEKRVKDGKDYWNRDKEEMGKD